jgi:3-oxoacyl-[acyl-carrier-protein] synthase-1
LKTPIHVVGKGVVSAIGMSVAETLDALRNGRSGISHISLLETEHRGKLQVGEIRKTNDELTQELGLQNYYTRVTLLGIHAAREAIRDAGFHNGCKDD